MCDWEVPSLILGGSVGAVDYDEHDGISYRLLPVQRLRQGPGRRRLQRISRASWSVSVVPHMGRRPKFASPQSQAGRGFHAFCPVIIRCGHRTRTVFSRYPTVRVNHPKPNVNGQMRTGTQFTRLLTRRWSPPPWRSPPFTTASSTPRCARVRAP